MSRSDPADNTVVYTPEPALRRPGRLLVDICRDLWYARELAWTLAVRDTNAKYRQSALGLLWLFVFPVLTMLAWIFIRSTGVVQISATAVPYPVFVASGTILWSIFMDAVNAPLQQVQGSRQMITKLNFPREALIVSGFFQVLFAASVRIVVLVALLALLGVDFYGWMVLAPLAVLSLVLAGTLIGLVIMPFGILYNDVGRALPMVLHFLMYLSPIVYPLPTTGWAAMLVQHNPLTPLVEVARSLLLGVDPGGLVVFLAINAGIVLMLLLALLLLRAVMPILIERMGA